MSDKRLLDLAADRNPSMAQLNEALVENSPAELWILAGQSNQVGFTDVEEETPDLFSHFPGFYMIETDGSIRAGQYPYYTEQLATSVQFHGRSGALEALRMRAAAGGRRIVVYCCAVGGTGLHWTATNGQWYGPATWGGNGSGGTLYQTVRDNINTALAADNKLFWKGLIWNQGENDADSSISGTDYLIAFLSMLRGWRNELNSDWMNNFGQELVVISQLTEYNLINGYPPGSATATDFKNIDDAVQGSVRNNPYWSFVRTDDLVNQADELHLDEDSQSEMAFRYLAGIRHAEQNVSGNKPKHVDIRAHVAARGYSVGETVSHEGQIRQANQNIIAGTVFTESQWDTLCTSFKSPDNTEWLLSVDNNGQPSLTAQ